MLIIGTNTERQAQPGAAGTSDFPLLATEVTGPSTTIALGLKSVNDDHGQQCGDDLLREISAATLASVRPDDVAPRPERSV